MNKTIYFLAIVLMILLNSCRPTNFSLPSATPTTDPFLDYRVPETLPKPVEGMGSVVGRIESENLIDLTGVIIYLGELVPLPENVYGAFLDPAKAPNTLIDISTGKFFVSDVKPGKYSLIIYEVVMGGKVYQDSAGNAIVVDVKPNEITDLGIFKFSFSESE